MLSLNVRGLRNGNKRRAIFSCLKKVKKLQSFVCKKPTHHPKMIKLRSAEWGASIIYSRGTTHSKGVCILLNPSSPFNLSTIKVDPEGRFLIAKLTIEEKYFFITNIYGPNNGCVLVYRYTKERNINELRHNSMYGYENNRNSLVCRYTRTAPNNCHDQDDFIKTLSQQLMSKTDTSKVIISGD